MKFRIRSDFKVRQLVKVISFEIDLKVFTWKKISNSIFQEFNFQTTIYHGYVAKEEIVYQIR